MASWLLTANLESAKPQVMPPPSAFAFPYGQSEVFEGEESPAASGTSGFGLGTDKVGGFMAYALDPTQPKMKNKNIEKKKGTLHKRRKQINKILKTMQDQQKRKTLLQERQTIVRELKRLTELEFTAPQVPPHSPPIDSASACSDHSHKENQMKGSDTSNTQPVTDPTYNAQLTTGSASPCKVKSKRSLRKRRREVYELLNNSLLTKKRKTELEQELADINSVLKKPRKTVFDELDFLYAEQLFGNVEEEQNHDVDQYIPNPEAVEPVHNNNTFEFKRTSKQTAKWNNSPDAFPQRGNQDANGTHLGEAYKESFRDYFNGNPAYADHYDNSFDEEQPHGSHEEHFESRLNPGSHIINQVLADDCRRHLESIGFVVSDTDGQISLIPRQQRERSPDLPLREGSPGLPNRERPPDFYREESPTHSYRGGSSDYPYRERSPALSYRGRSPCSSYREGSPCPSYRERSPDPSYQEGLPPPFYRERSPYHTDREVSPGPSYEEREMSPYPACRERFPDLSYRSPSDRGSHSRDGSQEPAPTSRFRRYSGHMSDAHEDFHQGDYSPRMEGHSPFRDHGGPDRYTSEDRRKEEEQREEDLRIHLLRLREQKVERRLKVLEQETKETESRLRRLQERRLSEELDDFLREQSKYWKKEDMEMERTNFSPQHGNERFSPQHGNERFSPQHGNERIRHGRRNHQIYF
ncbi:uncharacterized protein LOC134782378 [Penaeus indicus]|uniref:uncharacterized protein LOC134782378 n=1 Tax=Penaeus indicus TaxID=29960 RepID=UPI00300DA1BB